MVFGSTEQSLAISFCTETRKKAASKHSMKMQPVFKRGTVLPMPTTRPLLFPEIIKWILFEQFIYSSLIISGPQLSMLCRCKIIIIFAYRFVSKRNSRFRLYIIIKDIGFYRFLSVYIGLWKKPIKTEPIYRPAENNTLKTQFLSPKCLQKCTGDT